MVWSLELIPYYLNIEDGAALRQQNTKGDSMHQQLTTINNCFVEHGVAIHLFNK